MFERIKELAQRRGISLQTLAKDLGFSENYFYSLSTGSKMQTDKLLSVADYFGVSSDYLLGRVEKENEILSKEEEISIEEAIKSSRVLTYKGVILTDKEKKEAEKAIREILFKMAMEERKKNQ